MFKEKKQNLKIATFVYIALLVLFSSHCRSNYDHGAIEGLWQGTIQYPGMEIKIAFKMVRTSDGTLQAFLIRPDESTAEIPASNLKINKSHLRIDVASVDGSFEGKMNPDSQKIEGEWRQGVRKHPVVLEKVTKISTRKRPQTPVPPYPYHSEEVEFIHEKANARLAGTLTIPKNGSKFPAVILISGVGAHNRNYTLFGHQPFLVLSDYLTCKGIAVLRFDERGVARSTGNRMTASSEDFAEDVLAGVDYLRTRQEIDPNRIGLIGHSEGGTIASLASARSSKITFIVIMASPGLPGEEYNYQFEKSMGKVFGLSDQAISAKLDFQKRVIHIIKNETSRKVAERKLNKLFEELDPNLPENRKNAAIKRFLSPWFYFNVTHHPETTLKKITCPVLAIFGGEDIQVPPEGNVEAVKHALEVGGNQDYRIKVFPDVNHFFQTSQTGAPSEYGTIEETISPEVLSFIGSWILKHSDEIENEKTEGD